MGRGSSNRGGGRPRVRGGGLRYWPPQQDLPESRLPKSQLLRSQLTGSQLTGSQLPYSQLPYAPGPSDRMMGKDGPGSAVGALPCSMRLRCGLACACVAGVDGVCGETMPRTRLTKKGCDGLTSSRTPPWAVRSRPGSSRASADPLSPRRKDRRMISRTEAHETAHTAGRPCASPGTSHLVPTSPTLPKLRQMGEFWQPRRANGSMGCRLAPEHPAVARLLQEGAG